MSMKVYSPTRGERLAKGEGELFVSEVARRVIGSGLQQSPQADRFRKDHRFLRREGVREAPYYDQPRDRLRRRSNPAVSRSPVHAPGRGRPAALGPYYSEAEPTGRDLRYKQFTLPFCKSLPRA